MSLSLIKLLEEFESLRRVVPVWRFRGIGQRADAKWNKHEKARKGVINMEERLEDC